MNPILRLKELLIIENLRTSSAATNEELSMFVENTGLILPDDLIEYFKVVNGTSGEYDKRFFALYSLKEFTNLEEKFKDWDGTPSYKDIFKSFKSPFNCYVVADYQFHLFTYAIELHANKEKINEVYAICGGEFRVVADSFSHFIEKYLNDSDDLQF